MSRRVKKPLRPAGDRPKGARPYRGSAAERPQSYRPGGKPPARFPAAPPRAAKPFVPEPEKVAPEPPPLPTKVQTVVVTADENNMRVDRFLEARFPGLSFSHIQRIVRKGELRVNGKRADSKDRLEEGQSVRIPPLKLDTPKGARPALGSRDQDAAGPQGHDPLRGCRRHGAEQARGARRAGRLRHHAECRRHAGSDARRQGAEAAAGAPAGPGNLGLSPDRKNPLCRHRLDRLVPPSLGAKDLLGAGGRRAEAEAGPHLDLSRQGGERGRQHHAGRQTRRRGREPRGDLLCRGRDLARRSSPGYR